MKSKNIVVKSIILMLFVFASSNSLAAIGSSQATANPSLDFNDAIEFSKNLEKELAKRRVRVALVSRTGRPDHELPEGVEYTHVGFAVYSNITLEDGTTQPGYAMYNLYQVNEQLNRSELVQDYPLDFFSQAFKLKTGVIVPSDELQSRILAVIQSPTYTQLHNPTYSAIANPFNNKTQNCTEFIMNITQSAIYQTDDLNEIKQSMKSYFEPYKIPINPLSVIVGAMFSSEIRSTDHDGKFQTATFSSIKRYFEDHDLAKEVFELSM